MQQFSVLMSVYAKDDPGYLQTALESIYGQTVAADQVVLVCDGPLNDGLEQVIGRMEALFGGAFRLVRLEENGGLGNAMREGLSYCAHELVARMDSDDISVPDRFERQLAAFADDPELDVVSGTVLEFSGTPENIVGERRVPAGSGEIVRYSKKRSPFNHPAVMFRKSQVLRVGGYSGQYPLFEDYSLWVRLLRAGCRGRNLPEPLVYMRTSEDFYRRRGGAPYAKTLLQFYWWMHRTGWSGMGDFLLGGVPHALVCLLPNFLRKQVYAVLHR